MRIAAKFFLISVLTATLACAFDEPASAPWKRDIIIGADAGYCRNGRRVANVQAQCPEFQKHGKRGAGKRKKALDGGHLFFEGTAGND